MIGNLKIRNFKSIRNLDLNCKRVNLFIGEPNTGKSNILETIGILSHIYYGYLGNFVRFENMSNLFFDQDFENTINISFDISHLDIKFQSGKICGTYSINGQVEGRVFDYDYHGSGAKSSLEQFKKFKFYRFSMRRDFPNQGSDYLYPPDGDNLSTIIFSRKELRSVLQQIFNKFGYKLVIELPEGKMRVQKGTEEIVLSFPYFTVSETLQRIVFYLAAIYTNKESVLAFEEPESHAFPYYTKYLAERIALDQSKNQYFISTHNPYLLKSVLEKTTREEVSLFITYIDNYETKVKPLSESEIEELLDLEIDVLFNIEHFLT